MIGTFFHSIANKPKNDAVNELISDLLKLTNLPAKQRRDLNYSLKVGEEGRYPSSEYFNSESYIAVKVTKSLSEIKALTKELKEFYTKEALHEKAIISINEGGTADDFVKRLREIAESAEVEVDLGDMELFSAEIKNFEEMTSSEEGFKLGVSDIDSLTGGFQPGMVASVCAFTFTRQE